MNVYTCDNHSQHYPVGCASIVVAEDEEQAHTLLDDELKSDGLEPYEIEPYTLVKVDVDIPKATILVDGNY